VRTIRDVSVAVVGGAGFLGSHLVDTLIEDRGCKVVVMDNLHSGRREFVHRDATFEHIDITGSENAIYQCFKRHEVRFVFNYAAHPYIPDSFARPLYTFMVNAAGALQVINAAHDAKVEAILQVSSAEIYGDGPHVEDFDTDAIIERKMRLTEDTPIVPHSSYGAAKAAIDSLCQVRWKEAGTPVIAMRQFNAYGPKETHKYVIPEIISQLSIQKDKQSAIVRLGNNSFRDFQYAEDAVRMAVDLLENGDYGEVYNLGSENGIKIYDLATLIGKLMGFSTVTVEQDPKRIRPWEIWWLQSDNSKIHKVVKSRHLTLFEDGLNKTIEHFYRQGKWCWE